MATQPTEWTSVLFNLNILFTECGNEIGMRERSTVYLLDQILHHITWLNSCLVSGKKGYCVSHSIGVVRVALVDRYALMNVTIV